MSQLPLQNLHQQLVDLRGQAKTWLAKGYAEGFVPTFGICNHLTLTPSDQDLLADLFASWPGSSGDEGFPVPHPTKYPDYAYEDASVDEMWNPEHEYARNRWTLLDWLIEQTAPQFPYVVVRDPGTIHEEEIGTFATFLEAVAFASKNRDGHDVDVMKRQPDGSLTTEF